MSATRSAGPAPQYSFFAAFAAAALFFWIAHGISVRDFDRANAWHHYEYMVDGFLAGHAHLSLDPPKELLALPDPYDPTQNLRYRLWDASLYEGKYYLYYGTSPALLLMLPWKLLTGARMPQWVEAAVAASIGFSGLVLLLTHLRRKYFPAACTRALVMSIVLCAHVSWLLVILRRPAFWELPIITAIALVWWALYALCRFFETEVIRWAVIASTLFGFAIAARPTCLFAAATAGAYVLFSSPHDRRLRSALAFALPLACVGISLVAYNYARFGDVLEFGQKYQLWGMDEREVRHFQVSYVPFNARVYFLSIPEMSPYFPFFRTASPLTLPAGYIATEEMPGVLFSMPILLFAVIMAPRFWQNSSNSEDRALRLTLGACLAAGGAASMVLFCFAGACSRYIAELMAGITPFVGASLLKFSHDRAVLRPPAPVLRLLVGAATAWTILCVWLASFEFRAFARTTQPALYSALAKVLNYPSYWFARSSNQPFGPMLLDVQFAGTTGPTGTTLLAGAGRPDMFNKLVVDRDNDRVRFRLQINETPLVETPYTPVTTAGPSAAGGLVKRIKIEAPWLYPPAAHPYWNSYTDEADRHRRQNEFAIEVDGVRYSRVSPWTFDAARFEPYLRTANFANDSGIWLSRVEPR